MCGDQEMIAIGIIATQSEAAIPCPACSATRQAERLQTICGLTNAEREIDLADIDVTSPARVGTLAMVIEAKNFIVAPYGFLTLYGSSGNAKSMALMGIINAMLARNVAAVYTTLPELIGWLQEAYQRTDGGVHVVNESMYKRLMRVAGVAVLAIDEFDKVKQTEWVLQIESDIIDRRYRMAFDYKAGTVLAMNGSPIDLPSWIASRLSQWPQMRNDDPDLRPILKTR